MAQMDHAGGPFGPFRAMSAARRQGGNLNNRSAPNASKSSQPVVEPVLVPKGGGDEDEREHYQPGCLDRLGEEHHLSRQLPDWNNANFSA